MCREEPFVGWYLVVESIFMSPERGRTSCVEKNRLSVGI